MKNQIKYTLAGFCMGVAELIPGISGSTIAVIFKIYPNLMQINHVFIFWGRYWIWLTRVKHKL